jgi:undecaprenyl diphosphate synthase
MSDQKAQKPIACIGVILDGNRRWAKGKGLPQLEGHRRGFENLKNAARWVRDRRIPNLVVYAFSTENWNRSAEEVSYLMDIMRDAATRSTNELIEEGVRLRFVGEIERLAPDLQESIKKVEEESAANTKLTLWVCISYGGRSEIAAAARALASEKIEATEETIAGHLWSAGMPDPDIIIRTSGARRLSNFLLWQAAYSELFFLDTFWPAFSEKDLDAVLMEYSARTRNFGV